MQTELKIFSLFLAWLAYYAIHSLLATDAWKGFLQKRLDKNYRWYRLAFNIWAGLSFMGIWAWQSFLPTQALLQKQPVLDIVGLVLILAGFLLGYKALQAYDLGEFSGLGKRTEEEVPLQTEGLNAYVRHPLYSCGLMMLIGYALLRPYDNNWMFIGITIAYIFVGSWLEERKLVRRYGQAYIEYKKRVKRLIPFVL